MLFPNEYIDFTRLGFNPYAEPDPDTPDIPYTGNYTECTIDALISPYREYFTMFPDDEPIAPGYYICGQATSEDKLMAYKWAVNNHKHWWEYPNILPELIPGYWGKLYTEHPDWKF